MNLENKGANRNGGQGNDKKRIVKTRVKAKQSGEAGWHLGDRTRLILLTSHSAVPLIHRGISPGLIMLPCHYELTVREKIYPFRRVSGRWRRDSLLPEMHNLASVNVKKVKCFLLEM